MGLISIMMRYAVFFLLTAAVSATTYVKMSTYDDASCTTPRYEEYFTIGCHAYHASTVGSLNIQASSAIAYASKDCSGTALVTLSDTTTCTSSGTKMNSWATGVPAGSFVYDMWVNVQSETGAVESTSTGCTGTTHFMQAKDYGKCHYISSGVYRKWTCSGTTCTKTDYSNSACTTQTGTSTDTVVNSASGTCMVAVAGTADTKPYPFVIKQYSPTANIGTCDSTCDVPSSSASSAANPVGALTLLVLVTVATFLQ